jgi:hypothetical protein
MRQTSRLVLPSDPQYTAHREAQKRRQETREWLLQRERASVALHRAGSAGREIARRAQAKPFALTCLD